MINYAASHTLYTELKAEGYLLPDDCVDVELVAQAVDSPMQIKFTCFVTQENLAKIGRALVRMSEEG